MTHRNYRLLVALPDPWVVIDPAEIPSLPDVARGVELVALLPADDGEGFAAVMTVRFSRWPGVDVQQEGWEKDHLSWHDRSVVRWARTTEAGGKALGAVKYAEPHGDVATVVDFVMGITDEWATYFPVLDSLAGNVAVTPAQTSGT